MQDTLKDLLAAVVGGLLGLVAGFIVAVTILTPAHAFDLARDIPPQALPYLPVLSAQAKELTPDMPAHYYAALVEHESGCPAIKTMCWKPTARLKTQREEGAGLGQLTRAYKADGTLRFDSLAESRKLDPRGLNELRWDNVYQRPDLQMRVIVLMTRQNWHRLTPMTADPLLRLQLTDLAYNAGLGRSLNDRRACGLTAGCNPDKWYGHIERTCTASRAPIYGTRSACDISRHHVADVVGTRMGKYQGRV
jgi:hypothetical protein